MGILILYPKENLDFFNVPVQYLHWTLDVFRRAYYIPVRT